MQTFHKAKHLALEKTVSIAEPSDSTINLTQAALYLHVRLSVGFYIKHNKCIVSYISTVLPSFNAFIAVVSII